MRSVGRLGRPWPPRGGAPVCWPWSLGFVVFPRGLRGFGGRFCLLPGRTEGVRAAQIATKCPGFTLCPLLRSGASGSRAHLQDSGGQLRQGDWAQQSHLTGACHCADSAALSQRWPPSSLTPVGSRLASAVTGRRVAPPCPWGRGARLPQCPPGAGADHWPQTPVHGRAGSGRVRRL